LLPLKEHWGARRSGAACGKGVVQGRRQIFASRQGPVQGRCLNECLPARLVQGPTLNRSQAQMSADGLDGGDPAQPARPASYRPTLVALSQRPFPPRSGYTPCPDRARPRLGPDVDRMRTLIIVRALSASRAPRDNERLRPGSSRRCCRSRAGHPRSARGPRRRGFPRGGSAWWCPEWARSTASGRGATRARSAQALHPLAGRPEPAGRLAPGWPCAPPA